MGKELKKVFGNRVKHYRNLLGYSQEKLAELVGISSHTISYIERGKNFISMTKLSVLCNALQVEPYQLFIDRDFSPDVDKINEINRLLTTANEKQLNILIGLLYNILDIN